VTAMRKKHEESEGYERQRPASSVAGMPPNPNAMSAEGAEGKRLEIENAALFLYVEGHRREIETGHRILSGAQKGAATRWGEKSKERWGEYQRYLDARHRRYPLLTFNALTADAARHFKVSQKTIKRRCTNPRSAG
jgi:hypothetical protein